MHLKGRGKLTVQFLRENLSRSIPHKHNILFDLTIDFDGKKLDFRNLLENNFVSRVVDSDLLLNENSPVSYWIEMRCSKRNKRRWKKIHYNCMLHFGMSGIKEALLGINIGNPFRDIHTHPTHVSFVPASENTKIEAALGCAAEFGDICAHTGECKKVDDNLVCKSASQYHDLAGGMNGLRTFEQDRCMCRETNMKWKYELKKCVMV